MYFGLANQLTLKKEPYFHLVPLSFDNSGQQHSLSLAFQDSQEKHKQEKSRLDYLYFQIHFLYYFIITPKN